MTNKYEVAACMELGKAQDVVLGEKLPTSDLDSLTGDFTGRYIVATDDND